MRAGRLRERIELRRTAETPDGAGGFEEIEAPLFSAWAAVAVPKSKEGIVAGQNLELRTHEVILRPQRDPAKTPRKNDVVLWRGERLRVAMVRPAVTDDSVTLDCELEA